MRTYRVFLTQTVTTSVEVEARSIDHAIEQALEEAPAPTNSTNHGIEPSGEWTETEIYDVETGAQLGLPGEDG